MKSSGRLLARIPLLSALLLASGVLPAQREAFTLSRLVKLADKAALFRVERLLPLGKGETALVLTALDPVKGIQRFEALRVLSRGDLCFEADLRRLPGGSKILLFAKALPGRPGLFAQLPGGLLPGDPRAAEAARALEKAGRKGDLVRVLALQLENPCPRVWQDALLSLFRSRTADLSAQARLLEPALVRLVHRESLDPDAFATWAVRLALRLGMKEVVPYLSSLYIRSGGNSGFDPFLLKAMKRLDPEGAVRSAALARTGGNPRAALAKARLLAAMGSPGALEHLKALASRSPFPEVRSVAKAGLAAAEAVPGKGKGTGKAPAKPLFRAIFKGRRKIK